MAAPQTRARTALATALGIVWPSAVALRDGRVWLTSRYDVLPAHLVDAMEAYLARRAAGRVRDERVLAEAVALVGAESARLRDELPGLGAAAALDRLLAVPGLDQSRVSEGRALLRVALRSAAAESPAAAARLAALPGETRPVSVSRIVATASGISERLSTPPAVQPRRRLARGRTLTRAVDVVGGPSGGVLTAEGALAALGRLSADDLGVQPEVVGGLARLGAEHVRVEVAPTLGTLVAQGRLAAGTAEDPHVLRISPQVGEAQLAQVWTHQVSLMTQELAAERPSGMLGRFRYAFGAERRDMRLRADFATYRLLSKEWRQAEPGRADELKREIETLAASIQRRGGALPDVPWAAEPRIAPDASAIGRAVERTPPDPLREQVGQQIDELGAAVAQLEHLADTKVASAAEATDQAAELEEKALAEEQLRDLGAPERARVFRVEAVAASNKAQRHTQLATRYRQAAEDAQHALTGYQDLLTALGTAEQTALAVEARDRVEVYEASLTLAMPVAEVLETGVPTGAPLLAPVAEVNRVLAAQKVKGRLDGDQPRPIPTAAYRRLMSDDGMIVPVGDGLGQVRLRMKRRDFTEVVDRDYNLAEQMSGAVGAGGQGVGIASTFSSGTSYGVNLQPFLPTMPVVPRGDVTQGTSITRASGLTTHAQYGQVEDDRGESLLYEWTGEWEIAVRRSPGEPWSAAETVDAGRQLTWIQSAYTVNAPTGITTLNQTEPGFPAHTVTRINGLQRISDQLAAQIDGLDRIAYDDLNNLITSDPARLMHEFTKPGGLTRKISVQGRPTYELTVEFEPVWSSAKLSGEPSTEVWKEAVEVDFSGVNASESYGTSITATAGVGAGPVSVGAGRSVSHSGGQSVSTTAITPVVHRDQGPTQGVLLDFKVKATLRKAGKDPIVADGICEARLRLTENDLLRAGGPAAADAVRRDAAGKPRLDQDGRTLLRGDPEPPTGPQALPFWHGANQLRGPGKALASNLKRIDEAQLQALIKLSKLGLVPPLDADHQPRPDTKDHVKLAGQMANYERIVQNITAHRIQAGMNQACQGGLPVTLVVQATGHTPHYRHFRLGVEQDFDDVEGRGTTSGRNVVRLGIASGATSRSSSRSRSIALSAGGKIAAKFGLMFNRTALGRSLSWTSGRRVNRVTLTESTEPLDLLRQGVRITLRELTDQGLATPVADVHGTVDLAYESSLTRAVPHPTPVKAPSDLAVRQAITVAVDAHNPADQIFTRTAAFRADSSAVEQLHAALSAESLVAHPDWMNGSFEIPMIVTHAGTITAQEYKIVLRGRAVDQDFLAITQQNTGNVNLTLTDAGVTSGTSASGGAGVDGGAGPVSGSISRNAGTSQSTGVSRATGQEWLLVNTGTHYELLERYQLEADVVDGHGNVVQTIQLDDALAQKAMAERRALALYASGELDLPLPVVADVAERYLTDRVTMEPRVAAGFVRRYNRERAGVTTGLAAEHDTEQLAAKVFESTGEAPSQVAQADEKLRATETLAAQRVPVDLGPSYEESLGSAQLESVAPEGRPDEQVDLFELVRPQFEQIAPGVLAESKLLAPALRVNLNPDAYQGSLENMLGPRGFVATVEVPVAGQLPDLYQVRITGRYVGSYTVDGTPEIPRVPSVIGLDQGYGHQNADRSAASNTSYGASLGGGGGAVSGGGSVERARSTSAGSGEGNATVARTGHFDLAEVRRTLQLTSEVARIRGAGAAEMTSTGWKLGRTTPDERMTVATPRTVTAEVTLFVPRKLVREPGSRHEAAEQHEHRPIEVTESAVAESTTPYGRGEARTNQLYDAIEAELSQPRNLGAAGFAEHTGTLDGYLQATAMKANFQELIGPTGLRLPPFVPRGNGGSTVSVTIKARMTGFELAEEPIGDAQTGAVSRRETSTKSASSGSHLGPGSVNSGVSNDPFSVGASAGQQVKEQNSDAYGGRLETSKFEEGELVTVRIPVSYDLTVGRRQLPEAAKGQYFVKMLKHEYLDALRKMERGATTDAALAGARLQLPPEARPGLRAAEVREDADGNQVYEPYQPLVDALRQARADGSPVVVSVLRRDGHEETFVALPNGTMTGGDGGFGSAFAGLDQRIALMAQGRVDLRELHNELGPDEDFSAKVADQLVANGVPASMLKGLDYSTTARQLRPEAAKPVTVGSRPAREQERHH